MHRTRAYWPTRILFLVGMLGAVAVLALAIGSLSTPCFSCDDPAILGVPSDVLLPAVAVTLAVVGLVWLVRIVRGPRDEPPAWRYRDRR
jgi:hypothetical protein